jgi:hypothetical protein
MNSPGGARSVHRDIFRLQKEIEAAVKKLKGAKDMFLRREHLKALRRLIDEAESGIGPSKKPKAS